MRKRAEPGLPTYSVPVLMDQVMPHQQVETDPEERLTKSHEANHHPCPVHRHIHWSPQLPLLIRLKPETVEAVKDLCERHPHCECDSCGVVHSVAQAIEYAEDKARTTTVIEFYDNIPDVGPLNGRLVRHERGIDTVVHDTSDPAACTCGDLYDIRFRHRFDGRPCFNLESTY